MKTEESDSEETLKNCACELGVLSQCDGSATLCNGKLLLGQGGGDCLFFIGTVKWSHKRQVLTLAACPLEAIVHADLMLCHFSGLALVCLVLS